MEIESPSTSAENDTWEVGERNDGSCGDVAVSTAVKESGADLGGGEGVKH